MHIVEAGGRRFGDAGRFGQQVGHLGIDHAADGFMHPATPGDVRKLGIHFGGMAGEQAHALQLVKRQHAGTQAVVDIVVVVGDFVGQVADLRLQRGAAIFEKAPSEFAQFACPRRRAVLEDALARFEHQVEAVEGAVALFQAIDDAQALQVVLEAAMALACIR
jgi:hypothetical protein